MFRRRYIIWIGICAIIAPLLVNLWTQYRSLTELQKTSPLARQASWEHRLGDVATDVQGFYRDRAIQALNLPPQAILKDKDDDAVEVYFRNAPAEGVKWYFISSPFSNEPNLVKVTLYDPATRTMVREKRSEHWAAFSASSSYFSLILRDASVDRDRLVFGVDDPDNRIIAKPITDASSRAVGVAGMIVDSNYFRNNVLPQTLPDALRESFSQAELDEMTVFVLDDAGRVVTSTRPVTNTKADVVVPLQLAFSNWTLGATTHGLTHEELATRNFDLNISLTVLNSIALVVGIALALRAAGKELKISQMKSDFVSNVSHELRTPLSSIRVLGEFLRSGREIEPDKLRRYGEYIETESERLAKLINNILDFSKIESGQRTYEFAEHHIEFIVAEVLRMHEVRLVQQGFQLEFEVPDEPLPVVSLDPDAVTQAITNLLDNAIKYSGTSRTIGVRVWRDGDWVSVSVTDLGVGIPQDELRKIFDRFHRVSTGLVHNVKGSGLGLSLVKHIVEAHGGRVQVTSEVGSGSTFTLQFPAAARVTDSHAPKRALTDDVFHLDFEHGAEPRGSKP
ncbi:MAG TPA: HAMP domain-containing sensor histidine kinase [Blastocatellia bacterium]|nr:HAMP domain-containing sensor histidine kinase [Blastocatellia bacterium]